MAEAKERRGQRRGGKEMRSKGREKDRYQQH